MKYIFSFIFIFSTQFAFAQHKYFVSFDGCEIAYLDEGDGEVVILVHGFISNGSSWSRTAIKDSLLADGFRVIVPDLRGNGMSDTSHSEEFYMNDAEVHDLKLLADYLKVENYKAIGYSRGSIVLSKLLTIDQRITKAVIGGMGIDFTNPQWQRRVMFQLGFEGQTDKYPDTKGAVDYAKSIGADLYILSLIQKYQPVTSEKELKFINAKVLVIAGDEDKDNGDPDALHKAIPNSKLVIVKGDHNTTYRKDLFAREVMKFLN